MPEPDVAWVDKLLVKHLKEHLKAKKLSTSGLKWQLAERLKAQVIKEELEKAAEPAEEQEDPLPSDRPGANSTVKNGKGDADDKKNVEGEEPGEHVEATPLEIDLTDHKDNSGVPEEASVDVPAGADAEESTDAKPKVEEKLKDLPKKEDNAATDVKEQEIDDILGEDEMDDMAFELEPTPKGKKRRSQPSRSAAVGSGNRDIQMKEATSDGPHEAVKDALCHGESSEKHEKTQGGSLVDDDKEDQEEVCTDNLGSSDLKKRKLEEASRMPLDHHTPSGGDAGAKRKRIPIPVPVSGNKEPSQFGLRRSGSISQAQVEAAEPGTPPTPAVMSCAIRINNFVRPFVEKNCRELLEQYGKVTDMWMPSIKTHCYVVYETEEQALRAYKATYNLEWPVGGRKLIPLMIPAEEARLEIERGRARTTGKSNSAADLQGVSNAGFARANSGIGMGADNRLERGPRGTHPQIGGPYRRPVNRPVTLEDLFFKTHTKPPLYYLPLTDEQIVEKRKKDGNAGQVEPTKRVDADNNVNGALPSNMPAQDRTVEVRDEIHKVVV